MRKKDKLYTVNKWNKPMLIQKGNVFGFGGSDKPSDWTRWNSLANNYFTNEQKTNLVSVGLDPTEVYKKSTNFLGISKENNPFSNGNLGSTVGGLANGIASAASPFITKAISGGFSTNGVGETVANVGNVAGEVAGYIPGIGQFAKPAVKILSAVAGGIVNRGFGVKENEENTSAIKANTTQARTAGNELASANSNEAVLAAAGSMTGSSGFKASDLYKNGWWTSKGTKKGNALINKENVALAYQGQGMKTGVNNADRNIDENAQSSFIYGFGGPLEMVMDNSGGIGATEYDLISNFANKKSNAKDSMASPFAGVPSTMFAKGGKINIKKSHRGKLTELKKRTGKTEAELYNDGNPAHKKMVVFARNARKWKKAYGGFLDATDNLFDEGGPKGDKWVTTVGTVSAGGFVPNNTRGSYGGGRGIGGGAGTKFRDVPEYETVTKNDTIWIPIERNFNDAFRDAARRGLTEFEFNNITYPVEYADKEGWEEAGNARKEVIGAIPVTTERKTTTRKKAEGGPINVLNPYCGGGKMFALGGPDNLPQFLRYAGALGSTLSILPKNTTVEPELTASTRRDVQPSDLSSILLKEYSKPYPTAVKQSRVSPILSSEYAPLGEVYRQAALENENKARQIAEFNRSVNGLNNTAFALGGDMQTNGADWSNGMTHIDAGSTHELNPYEGVQVGVDSEGTPNLVEEGEVIFNDYVYSNRIEIDDQTKEAFRISKKRKITYADLAKKLEKESLERPNDPISKAALKVQMEDLANEQERQKSEMQATEARQAFEALSPEEQVAVMQQMQAQEQQAQEAAMQEQAMAEQQAMQGQQVPPEMMQGAPAEAMPQEQMILQEQAPVMAAYGGRVNRFDFGGEEWLRKTHPEFSELAIRQISKLMEEIDTQENLSGGGKDWSVVFNRLRPSGLVVSDKKVEQYYNNLVNRGLDPETAFHLAYNRTRTNEYDKKILHDKLVGQTHRVDKLKNRDASPQIQAAQQMRDPFGINRESQEYTTTATTNMPPVDARSGATTLVRGIDTPPEVITGTGTAEVAQPPIEEETPKVPVQKNQTTQGAQGSGTAGAATRAAGNGMVNAGSYKTGDAASNWHIYTRGALVDYLQDAVNRIEAAPTEAEKMAIRNETMSTINGVQEAYARAYQGDTTPSALSEDVKELQTRFRDANGNKYFTNVTDVINLPAGHNTSDRVEDNFTPDSLWGPKTALRNFGSTEYAYGNDEEYYRDIMDLARRGGMRYAANPNLIYGDNNQLYTLSALPAADVNVKGIEEVAPEIKPIPEGGITAKGNEVTGTAEGTDTTTGTAVPAGSVGNNIKPVLRKEWPRYMGLFGPAVGLGMQLAGIGKPDTKLYDSVIEGFDKNGASLADYRPIGDYMTYRPMDIWATQNRMDANARATDRALLNNSSASRAAGLLANAYTSQLGTGELHRQALEYNDNLRKQVAEFNRGTNQFNASAYNQAALTNAQIRNQNRNLRAQLGMQAAAYKNNANDNWYGSIYANVGNLFKGIGDLGRENAERNMLSKLLASGYTNLNDIMGEGWVQEAAEGGKLKRKKNKRRGLTF